MYGQFADPRDSLLIRDFKCIHPVNFFADPYAVRELLTPDVPEDSIPLDRFLLLPLDITTSHQLTFARYTAAVDPRFASTADPSRAEDKPPLHHFTSAFLERTREIMRAYGTDGMELHDPTAIWCAIENPPSLHEVGPTPLLRDGWYAERRKFQVERSATLFGPLLQSYSRLMCYVQGREKLHEGCSSWTGGSMRVVIFPARIAQLSTQN